MAKRTFNFCAGPATLPSPVLERAKEELVDFQGTGMSVMEMSHRSSVYDAVHNQAKEKLKALLEVPDTHEVLFVTGGASSQFALIPMNFSNEGDTVEYVDTGVWTSKAIEQAQIQKRNVQVIASSEDKNYSYIPSEIPSQKGASYLHICSNNTIVGTQYKDFPNTENPLIADMSSDILSKPLDVSQFHLIYAGAQKNIGPAGVCIVIARKDFIEEGNEGLPSMFSYKTHLKANSLYNTPPSFAVYMVGLVMDWLEGEGGLAGIDQKNQEKAALLYNKLDSSEYYIGTAEKENRSLMNVPFRLKDEGAEDQFLKEAEATGFSGLKGHRLVGGLRASIYNAFPKEGIQEFVAFMDAFEAKNA